MSMSSTLIRAPRYERPFSLQPWGTLYLDDFRLLDRRAFQTGTFSHKIDKFIKYNQNHPMKFPITRESLQAFDYVQNKAEKDEIAMQNHITLLVQDICG